MKEIVGKYRNTFGNQGNTKQNFWEQGNSVKVNFGEHLNLFMRNMGTAVTFSREQGNMHPLGGPKQCILVSSLPHSLKRRKKTNKQTNKKKH